MWLYYVGGIGILIIRENLLDFLQHDVPGIVGLANTGKKNTNNSQFYITTVPCPHLDGKNVAIGKVVKGLSIVKQISECATVNDKPLKVIKFSSLCTYSALCFILKNMLIAFH